MNITFLRFPNGRAKALTLSYDDGVDQDVKLMEILDRYGLKCTFNISSGLFAPEGKVYAEGNVHRRMTKQACIDLYKNSGHEVALHSETHPWLANVPSATVVQEVINDRLALEEIFGGPIRGMAYPIGSFSDEVIKILHNAGILYSRTTISTRKFDVPKEQDWLKLPATCHHKDARLMELAEKFVNTEYKNHPQLFYLWGHSYEFEENDNWDVIERFAEFTGGKEDIWYATNIEIFEYIQAFNRLVWSADMSTVKNPSAIPVWVKAGIHEKGNKTIKIDSGKTVKLYED